MKIFKKLIYLFILALFTIIVVACGGTNPNAQKHIVEFVNTDLENYEIESGSKITKPTDPKKDSYVFENWYEDEGFTKEFDFNKAITSDIKIYASFYLTLPKAIEIADELEHNQVSSNEYYVKGIIKSIVNVEYGNMTITDGDVDLFVYGVFSFDGKDKFESLTEKPVVGDTVYLRGPFKKFNNEVELNNSKLMKFEKADLPEFNIEDYEKTSIDVARKKNIGSKVLVEGVVSTITFANNRIPNGLYLVDGTNSIYIHDNKIASSVEVGNTIKVAGVRANFILESETGFANKFGYEGAIQLDNATLIEKDNSKADFNKEWILEKTIKEIMDTDYTKENITTTIFKVNALIKKVPGTGFVNYYFNDLDEKTGSYVYTMNNGNDFNWLDEFDGQLKTVYLSVINAKGSNSGILYRFVPIAVEDDFNYDQAYNPEFAVKYHGLDQFEKSYLESFSPNIELVTNVSSEFLGFENVKLTYSSSNEEIAYFDEIGDKIIFKTNKVGIVSITVTGIDGENTYSETFEIEVKEVTEHDSITVLAAIESDDDNKVIITGIVGASLVNQSGFYLIDETGVIAVRMAKDELNKLQLGNKVVIEGVKTHVGKTLNDKDEVIAVGQIAIVDAVVLVNKLGNHEYSTSSFKEGKVLNDFRNLDKLEDHSTQVYVIEATIKYEETPYYTRYTLIDDNNNSMLIYSSSGNQLQFLSDFKDQKVQIEFTVVNWNGKGYSGSIISIIHNGEKIVNNSNFR